MKKIKTFEAFTLPGRNITELIRSCFQDMLDEQGDHVVIDIRPYRESISLYINIDQQLKKSEIEAFCDEYIFPGVGRVEDEGFDLIPQSPPGLFARIIGEGQSQYEHYYNGIKTEIDGKETQIFCSFKNELK